MIGDPSGRSLTRPQLTHEEVLANAQSYRAQAFKVLDPKRTRTVFNGDWFKKMSFAEVIHLNSRVTLQQMLQREDFKQRIEQQQPIRAHEIQYPIMQGWDSVEVQADVELGKGQSIAAVCKIIGITDQTYYRWRKEYGGLKIDQAKRFKELEQENARLKRLLAEAELDKAILREAARPNF